MEENLSRIPGEPESRREDAPALAYKSRRPRQAEASTSNQAASRADREPPPSPPPNRAPTCPALVPCSVDLECAIASVLP